MRPSGRAPDEMRAITIEPNFTRHAEGSVLIGFGDTRVLVTASVEERIPPWLRGKGEGWVTAEYGMLPRATHTRGSREAAKGKQSGRTQEIQRLIGRSLRAVTDLKLLGERQITLDCDVIQADGGTRTASISGAWVALRIAVNRLLTAGLLEKDPIQQQVAAVSCGIYKGTPVLDLDYDEDSAADADANFVLLSDGKIAEAQATAEGACFDEEELLRLLRLARIGCAGIFEAQAKAGDMIDDEDEAPRQAIRKLAPGKLVIASHNAGKVREIEALLGPHGIAPVSAAALGLPEPEETGTTFVANAGLKALQAADLSGLPALADDSGLCVEALGGDPGIFSARWAGEARDFAMAMLLVEQNLIERGPKAPRDAHFVCALALAWPDGHVEWFEGRVDGTLVWPPRGQKGFGYDPMFVPIGQTQTFGEMDQDAKHAISHRARAFAQLVAAVL